MNLKEFKISTKAFPFKAGMLAPVLLRKQFMESFDALKINSIDIFYLHAPDNASVIEETLRAVNELFIEGKFKEFGLSNYAAWQVADIWYSLNNKGMYAKGKDTFYQQSIKDDTTFLQEM